MSSAHTFASVAMLATAPTAIRQGDGDVMQCSKKPHQNTLRRCIARNSSALFKDGYTLVTLPRIVTPYRDSVDGTRARVTY
jgi:hypothetical protein